MEDVGGLFNPTLRFAFTNITTEAFTSHWDKIPIVVKPGESIEISTTTPIPGVGHALAVKMTGEMVDKIMIGEAKLDEVAKNQPYYRSPKGSSLGVPAARKVWEDQILRQLEPDEESPAIQSIRKQMLAEIQTGTDTKATNQPVHVPVSLQEFSELGKNSVSETKTAVKVKTLGRPKKVKLVETSTTPTNP